MRSASFHSRSSRGAVAEAAAIGVWPTTLVTGSIGTPDRAVVKSVRPTRRAERIFIFGCGIELLNGNRKTFLILNDTGPCGKRTAVFNASTAMSSYDKERGTSWERPAWDRTHPACFKVPKR